MCRFVLCRERVKIQHVQLELLRIFGIQLNFASYAIPDDMPRFLRSFTGESLNLLQPIRYMFDTFTR
jgi:hypothetical protein